VVSLREATKNFRPLRKSEKIGDGSTVAPTPSSIDLVPGQGDVIIKSTRESAALGESRGNKGETGGGRGGQGSRDLCGLKSEKELSL